MKAIVVRSDALAEGFVLAPERYLARASNVEDSVALEDLVEVRSERVSPRELMSAIVVDTTHARDGLLDIPRALRDQATAMSSKKRAVAGDVIVSRLRPYLRQIAYVHPAAISLGSSRALALSTEFYVLKPREDAIAFLLPFLLSAETQSALAAAQEGGHHPRVPLTSLLAMRVPTAIVRASRTGNSKTIAALAAYYESLARLQPLLGFD